MVRVCQAAQDTWWFSADGSGRFDLTPPYGTCYLATDAYAAIREATRLGPVSNMWVLARELREVAPPDPNARLASAITCHVRRPNKSASVAASTSPIAEPITSGSKKGIDQPPCRKSPSRSSSGPPGAWQTPSRDMNSLMTMRTASLWQSGMKCIPERVAEVRIAMAEDNWQQARLIPTSGIKGTDEAERRPGSPTSWPATRSRAEVRRSGVDR